MILNQIEKAQRIHRKLARAGVKTLDSGYVFAPYVPLITTPMTFEPGSLKFIPGRYSTKNNFTAKINGIINEILRDTK